MWIESFDDQQATSLLGADNYEQTCRQQAVASHVNASCYRLVDNKSVARCQQTCCNLHVSGCVFEVSVFRCNNLVSLTVLVMFK